MVVTIKPIWGFDVFTGTVGDERAALSTSAHADVLRSEL